MPQENDKVTRDWRQIVADAYKETDAEKLRKLAEELDRAIQERDRFPSKSEQGQFSTEKSP